MMDIPKRTAEELMEIQAESRAKLKEADSVFENSELLATLKAKSEANKEKCAVPPPTSSPSIVLVPMLSAALIPCHVRLSPQEREGAVQQVLHEAGRAGHRGLWWAEGKFPPAIRTPQRNTALSHLPPASTHMHLE